MKILLNESYNGINGVKEIDSGISGPVIGISACTHGGEHAGLRVIKHLFELGIRKELIKGKIFFYTI